MTYLHEDNAGYDDYEYYFIFLQAPDAVVVRELQLILDHCLANYWLHCNVMVQTIHVEVLIYSYYPYAAQHCQQAQPQLVNRFDGRHMVNSPMFPNKLRQMHRCPLRLLLWHTPPFVELSREAASGQWQASGFEMQLVEHLAQHLNFTIVLDQLPVQQYQQVEQNVTSLGPLELASISIFLLPELIALCFALQLQQRQFNLSIGYFRRTASRDRLLTSPPAHYNSPLVATVKSDDFRFGRLALITFPFQWCVWGTLLGALLLHWAVYVWHWPRQGFQVFELLLGNAMANFPRNWMQRLIYSHWLWGTIPLRIVYQSLLFHFIRFQLFETLPISFEQLLASDFQALCTASNLQMLNEMPQVQRSYGSFKGLSTSYDQDVLDALHRREEEGQQRHQFAITGMDLTNAYLRATNREQSYQTLTQYVNIQQVVIYMPKHSYLHKQFTELIRRLDAGGFIAIWRRAAFTAFSQSKFGLVQSQSEEQRDREQRQRHHQTQMGAIYGLMGILYCMASVVFGAELLLHRFGQS